MSDSTSILDLLTTSQAQKDVTANELFNAAYPAEIYAYRAKTTSGLTWGYYGGRVLKGDGTAVAIANGTLTLTASATNYIVASRSTGAVSVSTTTTNWNDLAGYMRLYLVITGSSTITSWEDHRGANPNISPVLGQAAGSGGAVTQTTSKATGVTLNKLTGKITLTADSLAGGAAVSFTLTNSTIKTTDLVLVGIVGGAATPGSYAVGCDAVGAGQCTIFVRNLTAVDLAEALVLRYMVLRGQDA